MVNLTVSDGQFICNIQVESNRYTKKSPFRYNRVVQVLLRERKYSVDSPYLYKTGANLYDRDRSAPVGWGCGQKAATFQVKKVVISRT